MCDARRRQVGQRDACFDRGVLEVTRQWPRRVVIDRGLGAAGRMCEHARCTTSRSKRRGARKPTEIQAQPTARLAPERQETLAGSTVPYRKSEYPRVPTSPLGYAMAVLVGGAVTLVLAFLWAFFGLASGCLSFLDQPTDPCWLHRDGWGLLLCPVVGVGGALLLYRLGRGRMTSQLHAAAGEPRPTQPRDQGPSQAARG